MDTSTPTSTDAQQAPPEPGQRILETVREQAAAIDALFGIAKQIVRVFDVDLSQTGWNTADRVERITAFLRRDRNARLEIIVHDTRYIESECARLAILLRNYSHAITLYRTGFEAAGAMDPLVVVDGRHFLHRFHWDGPRASLGIEQPIAAGPLDTRFEEIWATGQPGLSATVLGL